MPEDTGLRTLASPRRLPAWTGKLLWPVLALALLLAFNAVATPNFFNLEIRDGHLYGSLIDILNHGAKVMILALGMTLVIATGGVDLSVGAVMAIAGALAAMVIHVHAWPFAAGLALVLGVCLLAGAWNGMLVAVFRVQPIVATLILMVAGRGVAQLLTDGKIITFTDPANPALIFLGNGHLLGLPFPVAIVAVMLALTVLLTRRTALGLFIESVGDNETASHFSGVQARSVKFMVYVFSAFCAGVAGLIAASNIKAADSNNAGLYLELDAILAVVIGGTALTGGRFYLVGAVIGALLIQTLTTTIFMRDVSAHIIPLPKALVIVIVCLLQSPAFRRKIMAPFVRRAA